MDYSYIKSTVRHNQLGMLESIDYEWEGDSPLVRLDYRYEHPKGDIIWIGKFQLKRLNFDYSIGAYDYIRMDYPFWRLVYLIYKISPVFRLAYSRIIITLCVWNLASYSPGVIPSYNDIFLVKKIKEALGGK